MSNCVLYDGVVVINFFKTVHNKTILKLVLVIPGIIKVEARLITPDLDYSGYHKKPHPIILLFNIFINT